MKKLLLSSVALVIFAAPALSADLARTYTKAPVLAPALDWSGFYLGAHGGYGSAQNRGTYDDFADFGMMDFRVDGGVAGGQIGYNYMVGRTLYGIELDGSWANINGSIVDNEGDTRRFRTSALASGRFRSGVAVDNWLLFSSIGVGYARSRFTVNGDVPSPATQSLNSVGLVTGLGAEWAASNNWSLRAEYLYYYFNKRRNIPGLTTDSFPTDFVKLDGINVFRVAANYRFGGGGTARVASPSSTNWSGLYIGAHGGYGWSRIPGGYDEVGDHGHLDIDPRGALGGGQIGYNWQSGNWVYGLEGDGSFGGMRKSRIDGDADTQRLKTDTLASVRARVGGTVDDKMIYLTGGIGYAHSTLRVTGTDTPSPATASLSSFGAVVGSGVDWAFAPNWSARFEGLTYFFNRRRGTETLTNDSDPQDRIRQSMVSVVRAGINYKFGGPVVAKY